MKYHLKRPRQPGQPLVIKSLFRQPEEAFYRLPELEIRGGMVLTEGCRKVLDFDPQKLCLDMGSHVVTFYGQALRIESINGKRAVVAGVVARIDFTEKWAQPGQETDDAGK